LSALTAANSRRSNGRRSNVAKSMPPLPEPGVWIDNCPTIWELQLLERRHLQSAKKNHLNHIFTKKRQ